LPVPPQKTVSRAYVPGFACITHFMLQRERYFCLRLRAAAFVGLGLELNEILDAHLLDQPELSLQPVDMLFLAFENMQEKLAADIVLDVLAMRDRHLEIGEGACFQRQVAFDD